MNDCTLRGDMANMPASVPEIEQIYRKLEQGSDLLKFYLKGKPERRTFCVKLETRQVICFRPVTGRSIVEGASRFNMHKQFAYYTKHLNIM